MKCTIQNCPGEYEVKHIVHTVKRGDNVLVFENVPADVCTVCSDTLLTPDTVRHIEELVRCGHRSDKFAPIYEYV